MSTKVDSACDVRVVSITGSWSAKALNQYTKTIVLICSAANVALTRWACFKQPLSPSGSWLVQLHGGACFAKA